MVSDYALARLASPAEGVVHSVFRSSLNVSLPGILLHVGPISSGLSVLGIALPDEMAERFVHSVRVGGLVRLGDGALGIWCQGGVTRINLRGLEELPCKVDRLRGAEAVGLCDLLQSMGLEGRLGIPPTGEFDRVAKVLSHGIFADEGSMGCLRWLLGRGRGLTPSGDDVLVGYGIGSLMTGNAEPFLSLVRQLDLSRTTAVSAAYLGAMMDRFANYDYRLLADRLGRDDLEGAREVLDGLLRYGATSGADGLFGMRLALESALRNQVDG
jgi:hypothetical protein